MSEIDLQKAEREHARWLILSALNAARPVGTNEEIILSALHAAKTLVTHLDVRKELDYLEERELVEIYNKEGPVWFAKLTRIGVDLVEYTVPCDPGIARPKKWW